MNKIDELFNAYLESDFAKVQTGLPNPGTTEYLAVKKGFVSGIAICLDWISVNGVERTPELRHDIIEFVAATKVGGKFPGF